MNRNFLLVLLACVAVFVGLIFFNKKDATAPESNIQTSNHIRSEGTTGVTLIEYGDFECPACGAYYPLLKQLGEKYKGQVTFQFRNFPIASIHRNAMVAHRAAEAADLQGKFFAMHDVLYERQQEWAKVSNPISILESYAQELGLDMTKFKQDMSSAAVNDVIQADLRAGQALNVSGTPGFVLNDKLIENPNDLEAFSKVLDDAIKEKTTGPNQ